MRNIGRKTPQRASVKNFNKRITRFLVDHRISKGFSQSQLAKECGMSRTNLSEIERGAQRPSIYQFVIICSVLGISPRDGIGRILQDGHPATQLKGAS